MHYGIGQKKEFFSDIIIAPFFLVLSLLIYFCYEENEASFFHNDIYNIMLYINHFVPFVMSYLFFNLYRFVGVFFQYVHSVATNVAYVLHTQREVRILSMFLFLYNSLSLSFSLSLSLNTS